MPPLDVDALFAEDARLRRLARRLVADPAAADDAVQEAWLAALRRRSGPRSPARWLAAVVRRASRTRARSELRRRAREAAAARSQRVPPADEVAGELELRIQVVRSLAELDEPYRTALFLRFFRDEPLRAIAERQGVSVSTAGARVREGLARMRRALDRAHGGQRSEWALALLALEPPGAAAAALTTVAGGIAMGTTAKAAVAAAVVVAAAAGAWLGTRGGDDAPSRAAAAPGAVADAEAERPREPLELAARAEEPQRVVAATDRDLADDSEAGPAALVLRGRVVDLEGDSIAGARIVAGESDDDGTVSDRAGRFEITAREAITADDLALDDPVLQVVIRDDQPDEILLVASPRLAFGGVVVDQEDRPVGGARLSVQLRYTLFRDLGIPADSRARSWDATAGPDGRFEIQGAPGGERAQLHAKADGYNYAYVDLPSVDDTSLVVRLAPPQETIALRGVVLDPQGRPLEGASVGTGGAIVRSGADGRFAVAWRPETPYTLPLPLGGEEVVQTYLTAVHDGYAPARIELTPETASQTIELRLGAEPLSIDGLVVDEQGNPLEGIVFWVTDPTYLGSRIFDGPLGGGWSAQFVERCDARGGGARSKMDGTFHLEGLLDRDYHVAAYDPATMSPYPGWDVAAGTRSWRVVLRPDPDCRRVAGRVVWGSGEPVAGVRLVPQFQERWQRGEFPGGVGRRRGATTDEEGRFDFEQLFTNGVSLVLQGAMLERFQVVCLTGRPDLEDLELVARRRCELQIDFVDPSEASSALVLDERGEPVEIQEPLGNAIHMPDRIYFPHGRSSVVFVDETARTLVLMRGDEEVRRVTLRLDPNERTVLRL